MHSLLLTRAAAKQLEHVPAREAQRITAALRRLCDWPNPALDVRALSGELSGFHRLRVGDWRVVFRVLEARAEIIVTRVSKRQRAYGP